MLSKVVTLALLAAATSAAAPDCAASDERLSRARGLICGSLVGTPGPDWCVNDNAYAQKDWPTQAVYMKDLLDLFVAPDTCLDTPYAADTANWLDGEISDTEVGGSYMWTYLVFQVQYYDMPRNEGDRIESPATLGRKCWAMSYSKDVWNPEPLSAALAFAGLNANEKFIGLYNDAIPLTMDLCYKVEENCFVNATYDATRNGTCPVDITEFELGFERENLKRKNVVEYPFY